MRTPVAIFLFLMCITAEGHIGSPNVFFEGKAGEYPVRVVIRPPNVVPGLAEITVRVREPVQRVNVLPVFWKAGREGAPAPDEARLVRGETNLYSAELWLMQSGAYSVDVTIDGPRGKGTLAVPVNSMATNTRPMSRGYGAMLLTLAAILFLGGLQLARAVFGESSLDPGALPTRKERWRGRIATALSALALSLLMWGGKKWWDFEDRNYRNNALYQPTPVSAHIRTERDQHILKLTVEAAERRGRWTPLIPDHGKLMHLFLVRDGESAAFAHLHPTSLHQKEFEAPLPPLPAGQYHAYADVTHENGFSETLVASADIPPATPTMKRLWLANSTEAICSTAVAQMLSTNLFLPPDPDDSWVMERNPVSSPLSKNRDERTVEVGGGYKMIWRNYEPIANDLDALLRFELLDPENKPAMIEPYMGMHGHAVVRRKDGAVFAHIHPVGTYSMAAQRFFVADQPSQLSTLKERGATGERSSPSVEFHGSHTNEAVSGEISFPYAFPKPGAYCLWVQMKSQGRILTGVFDTIVAAAR
jgi:hypothetical protein